MFKANFLEGWNALVDAFDAKKSDGHMAQVFKQIEYANGEDWTKAVQAMIDDLDMFPKIATMKAFIGRAKKDLEFNMPPLVGGSDGSYFPQNVGLGFMRRLSAILDPANTMPLAQKQQQLKALGQEAMDYGQDNGELVL